MAEAKTPETDVKVNDSKELELSAISVSSNYSTEKNSSVSTDDNCSQTNSDFKKKRELSLADEDAKGQNLKASASLAIPQIICMYKETDELLENLNSMVSYCPQNIWIVCEKVALTTGVFELLGCESDAIIQGKWNEVKYKGLVLEIYVKGDAEMLGKRFSHKVTIERLIEEEYEFGLFRDCDTQLPFRTLEAMLAKSEKDVAIVGPTMVSNNYSLNSVIASYAYIEEISGYGYKKFFEKLLGNSSIITGSCFLARTEFLEKCLDDYSQISDPSKLIRCNSLMVEDSRLTFQAKAHGYRTKIIVDEANWALPETIGELMEQRRRWNNGGLATMLDFLPITPFLSLLFYFARIHSIIGGSAIWFCIFAFYWKEYPNFVLAYLALKVTFLIVSYHRKAAKFNKFSWIYLFVNCFVGFSATIRTIMELTSGYLLLSPALIIVSTLPLLRGCSVDSFFVIRNVLLGLLTNIGFMVTLTDYGSVNFGNVTWGVRETAADKKMIKSSSQSKIGGVDTKFKELLYFLYIHSLIIVPGYFYAYGVYLNVMVLVVFVPGLILNFERFFFYERTRTYKIVKVREYYDLI